jgi:hypothetical protein
LLSDPNIWIGDTGASVDMTPHPEGLIDTHPSDISVHVGNSKFKKEMVEPTVEKLSQLLQRNAGPKYLRMDNVGESKLLAAHIRHSDWKLPIIVEWTARDTPQQNSPAKVGFATIAVRARSMLQDADIPTGLRRPLTLAFRRTRFCCR